MGSGSFKLDVRLWLRRFALDKSGSVTVEFVIVIPLLFWCFLATFTFFEAYRTQTNTVKGNYLIGDQLSREAGIVVPDYVAGLGNLFDLVVGTADGTRMRVTTFQYKEIDDTYRVIWSRGQDVASRTQGDAIVDVLDRLPEMGENEVHILTETWLDYNPADMVGLPDMTFYEVGVTRMRSGRLCWKNSPTAPDSTAIC